MCSQVSADYSSLTQSERKRVLKAIEQSRSHKWLKSLLKGTDKLITTDIAKIKEEIIATNKIRHTYQIKYDLILHALVKKKGKNPEIKTMIFKRIHTISFVTDAKITSGGFWCSTWGKITLVATGAGLGVLIYSIVKSSK